MRVYIYVSILLIKGDMVDMFRLLLIIGLVTSVTAWPWPWPAVAEFDVFYYGASGVGKTDDSQVMVCNSERGGGAACCPPTCYVDAFVRAWKHACNAETDIARVVVPKGGFFLLKPIVFLGPCKPQMHFIISGTVIASGSPKTWTGLDSSQWIVFKDVTGLNVYGSGLIDGQGRHWWDQSCRYHPKKEGCTKLAPTVLKFISCNEGTLSSISIVNSPQTHVLISYSKGFNIDNVMIQSLEDSPNTDGIHIQSSHFIKITKSTIGTGDDCISIGDYSSNIDISNIECGPGHGISIGSLGKDGNTVLVEKIYVRDSSFKGTTNGARIKTWQVGRGNVRHIIFENLIFDAVDNPVIIDQNYCDVRGACKEKKSGVKISDVAYKNLYGTSSTSVAITLNCSRFVPCSGISMENINFAPVKPGKSLSAHCINVHGTEDGVNPGSCLRN